MKRIYEEVIDQPDKDKLYQVQLATPAVPYSVFVHVDVIARGTANNQRRSNQYCIKEIVWYQRLLGGASPHYSAFLLWDYQPNKALPVVADTLFTASSWPCVLDAEVRGRFLVLDHIMPNIEPNAQNNSRKTYYLDRVATTTNADTTGAIANRVTGALLLYQSGSGSTPYNAFDIHFEEV